MKAGATAIVLLVFFAPCLAHANGVVPVLNLFHGETWMPATVVTVAIILVESLLLRWRIKGVPFLKTLWRSFVLNLASSIAGSVLLVSLGWDSFFVWNSFSLVIPLFVITLITEIPLLYWLYRDTLSGRRSALLGSGINTASYAVVFAGEILFLFGWMGYAGRVDEKELATWKNPELLARASGHIYATESVKSDHGLRVFDFGERSWISLTNCPPLDPNKWDVQRGICAFVRWPAANSNGGTVVIASLPDFSVLREITLSNLMEAESGDERGWQGPVDVALSPDGNKVAILFHVADAVAHRNETSYFMLGHKCRLAVFSVHDGSEIARSKRWASGGNLCWFPDSQALLFASFQNEALYETTEGQVRGSTGYGTGYAKGGEFEQRLFLFNLNGGKILPFTQGRSPELAVESRQFVIVDRGLVRILDLDGRELKRTRISRLGFTPVVPSPDGTFFLTSLRRNVPFYASGRLTIIDSLNSSRRHIVSDNLIYRFRWIPGAPFTSSNPADVQ